MSNQKKSVLEGKAQTQSPRLTRLMAKNITSQRPKTAEEILAAVTTQQEGYETLGKPTPSEADSSLASPDSLANPSPSTSRTKFLDPPGTPKSFRPDGTPKGPVPLGSDDSLSVIPGAGGDPPPDQEVVPLIPGEPMDIDALAAETELTHALDLAGLKPGATVTPDLYEKLRVALNNRENIQVLAARREQGRAPIFPHNDPVLNQQYPNAAMSQRQQRQAGLLHVDARAASAVARARVPHRISNAVGPPPAVAPASGYVPVPGPAYQDVPACQLEAGGKLGNESVYLKNVVATQGVVSREHSQNVIAQVMSWYAGNQGQVTDDGNMITVTGSVSLPILNGLSPIAVDATEFHRTIGEYRAIRDTNVCWDDPFMVARVPEVALEQYRTAGNPETRSMTNQLKAKLDCSQGIASRIVTRLYDSYHQYGLEGLFFVLFLLADTKYTLERMDVQPGFHAPPEGAITFLNLAAEGDALAAALLLVEGAIEDKRICIHRRLLSAVDINVMRCAAQGPACFDGEDVNEFVGHYFRTPLIRFAVYDTAPAQAIAQAMPTANQFHATAMKFARILHAEQCLVRGWIRFQCVISGGIRDNNIGNPRFFMGTLEVETMTMPKPVGRNFLWDQLCDRFEELNPVAGMSQEYYSLTSSNLAMLRQIGAVIGALYTLSVSTYLTFYNFGGTELTYWTQMNPIQSTSRIAQGALNLVDGVPPILSCAVSNLAACTGFNMHHSCFRSSGWCGGFNHRLPEDGELWQETWGRHIPYLCYPISVSWILSSWHMVWGITGPHPGIHIARELFSTLPGGERMVAIHLGDSSYLRVAQSGISNIKVCYAEYFFNIYCQMMRNDLLPRFSFCTIQKSNSGYVVYGTNYFDDDEWQPMMNQAAFSLVPGTLRTYKWETSQVLGPILTSAHWPGLFFDAMNAIGNVPSAAAGFPLRRSPEYVTMGGDNAAFLAAMGILPGGDLAQIAEPDAPANREN